LKPLKFTNILNIISKDEKEEKPKEDIDFIQKIKLNKQKLIKKKLKRK